MQKLILALALLSGVSAFAPRSTRRLAAAVSKRQASNFFRDSQRGRKKPGDARVQTIRNCGVNWQKAILVLHESEKPTLRMFNGTRDVYARAQKPSEAIGLLGELLELGLKPTCATFNRVMKASANTGNWKSTPSLLDFMAEEGVMPDVVSTNTAASACGKARQWEKALELFNSMEGRGVKPNVISYSAAISACGKARQWEKALELFNSM